MKAVSFVRAFQRALPAVIAITSLPAGAYEIGGIDLTGYGRGGAYSNPVSAPRGGYTLGGDAQKFRLGNEGDTYLEVGIGKTVNTGNGLKLSALYMPSISNGLRATPQAFVSVSGLGFAPEASFWAGQRYLRIQDVHIVDRYFMDYGDNIGFGMTDYNMGFAKLGVGIFGSGTVDNRNKASNNANRLNVDLSEIRANEGGTLRVLGTLVFGKYQMGSPGAGLSISHNQTDFLVSGLTNTVFLQSATGHAGLSGQFQGLGDATTTAGEQPGLSSMRITDAINWQSGDFGGQALLSYQQSRTQGGADNGKATRDFSFGGRVSYAMSQNFKVLAEVGSTSRSIDGQMRQVLNKFTIAPALALAPDFWSRPELRLYLTYVNWNGAAAAANAGGFGAGGRTSSTVAGLQVEAWW